MISKLNVELKKLVNYYLWSIALDDSEISILRKLERKYFELRIVLLKDNGEDIIN